MLTDEDIEKLDDFNLWELSRHLIVHVKGRIIKERAEAKKDNNLEQIECLNNEMQQLLNNENKMKDPDVRRKIIKEVVKNGL